MPLDILVTADAIYGISSARLRKLAMADGRLLWSLPWPVPQPKTAGSRADRIHEGGRMTEAGSRLYVADTAGIHAVNAATGQPAWTFDWRDQHKAASDAPRFFYYSAPTAAGDRVYAQTSEWPGPHEDVFALDAASGRMLWRHQYALENARDGGRFSDKQPIVSGNTVHVFCHRHTRDHEHVLIGIDPSGRRTYTSIFGSRTIYDGLFGTEWFRTTGGYEGWLALSGQEFLLVGSGGFVYRVVGP